MTAVRAADVGTELPPLKIGPISRTTLALFAGASGDHNPMHIDIDVARSAGLDDVFAQGMLSMAYLGRLLTNWVDPWAIRHYRVRFAAITPVHGEPTATGRITAIDDVDGERRATLELAVTLADGTVTLTRGRRRRVVTPNRGNHHPQNKRKGLSTMGTLEGKVAIVSGSGRGIGREIALKLASEGAKVVVNDLDAEPAKETVAAIEAAGGQAVACVGSVTDADFGERFVAAAVDNFGGLDIIVNNAGYTWDSVIQKMTDEQWDAILDVHLKAPFRILRAAQPVIASAVKKAKPPESLSLAARWSTSPHSPARVAMQDRRTTRRPRPG